MPDQEHIIRSHDISTITGLSLTTIWRLEKTGKFPKRVHLSVGAIGWRMSEIQMWLATRK